ncbi:MAG: hypothetical protein JXK05_01470 [Campylobacterales bacterium]|nr:hypothetical protein [Campylobacterales bacterium]
MSEFFATYQTPIIFLHVLSAVIWVGGMIAMRFAAHYSFAALEAPQRLARTAHALRNLFMMVVPFVLLLLLTALIMAVGMGLHHGELKLIAFAKEGIWSVMALNLGAMIYRRKKAQRLIDAGEFSSAAPLLGLIGRVMVPVNIALGIVAIFLGVMLGH